MVATSIFNIEKYMCDLHYTDRQNKDSKSTMALSLLSHGQSDLSICIKLASSRCPLDSGLRYTQNRTKIFLDRLKD